MGVSPTQAARRSSTSVPFTRRRIEGRCRCHRWSGLRRWLAAWRCSSLAYASARKARSLDTDHVPLPIRVATSHPSGADLFTMARTARSHATTHRSANRGLFCSEHEVLRTNHVRCCQESNKMKTHAQPHRDYGFSDRTRSGHLRRRRFDDLARRDWPRSCASASPTGKRIGRRIRSL